MGLDARADGARSHFISAPTANPGGVLGADLLTEGRSMEKREHEVQDRIVDEQHWNMRQDKLNQYKAEGETRRAGIDKGVLEEQRDYDQGQEDKMLDETTAKGKAFKSKLAKESAETELRKAQAKQAKAAASSKTNKDELLSEVYTKPDGTPLKERSVKQLYKDYEDKFLEDGKALELIDEIKAQIEMELGKVDVKGIDLFNPALVSAAEQEIISRYQGPIDAIKGRVGSFQQYINNTMKESGSAQPATKAKSSVNDRLTALGVKL